MKVLICGYSMGEFVPDGRNDPITYYSLYVLEPHNAHGSDGYFCRRVKMTKGAYDAISDIYDGDIISCDLTIDLSGRVTDITRV